jgi:hypothetical protein
MAYDIFRRRQIPGNWSMGESLSSEGLVTANKYVNKAISDATNGHATIHQLAKALHLAEKMESTVAVGFLRNQIRGLLPNDEVNVAMKSLTYGIISGVITWSLLGGRGN